AVLFAKRCGTKTQIGRRGVRRVVRWRIAGKNRRSAGAREGRRLVSGTHGIWTTCAWQPLDSGRSAQPGDAEATQSENQIPGELPAVCTFCDCRTRAGIFRPRLRQPIYAAGCGCEARTATSNVGRGNGAVWHKQTECAAV